MLLPLSLNKYTETDHQCTERGPAARAVCLSVCARLPVASGGVGFHSPTVYLFKRLLCCCLHSFFWYLCGPGRWKSGLGRKRCIVNFGKIFIYSIYIDLFANKHSLPPPLDFGIPPPFFACYPYFLFSFSFSSADVDLEEAGKEGGKSREVMRLNKEGKWSYWYFSVSMCGRIFTGFRL